MISLETLSFPNLTSAGSIILYNHRNLNSLLMPELTNVTGSVSLSYLYQMTGTSLSAAFPNLQVIGECKLWSALAQPLPLPGSW